MRAGAFWRDQLPAVLLNLCGGVALALFLLAGGVAAGPVAFIPGVWAVVLALWLGCRFILQKRGLDALLESSRGQIHPAAADVEPAGYLHLILGVSAAAVVLAGAGALWYGRRRGPAARAGRAGPDGIQNGI